MENIRIIFFGSTTDSVLVLDKLPLTSLVAVVTQPPKPVGRDQVVTPTPVQVWAQAHNVTVLSFKGNPEKSWGFENEQTVIDTLSTLKADLLISASYGQKIPSHTIKAARFGGLNVHPSILPRWRGGDPVPWAIYTGDAQIGVTIVTLVDSFDQGLIISQKKIPLLPTDMPDPVRTHLFELGADLLQVLLPDYVQGKMRGITPIEHNEPTARRFTKADGFEPWTTIADAMTTGKEADRIERKCRAFFPWPGLWTTIDIRDKGQETTLKRLKILSCHLSPIPCLLTLDTVQLEGKKPTSYTQFQQAYLHN
jgi:methionyl-tRNA formyltransferase